METYKIGKKVVVKDEEEDGGAFLNGKVVNYATNDLGETVYLVNFGGPDEQSLWYAAGNVFELFNQPDTAKDAKATPQMQVA